MFLKLSTSDARSNRFDDLKYIELKPITEGRDWSSMIHAWPLVLGVSITRGPRSLNFSGRLSTQRFGGSFTCPSAEIARYCIAHAPVNEVNSTCRRPCQPGYTRSCRYPAKGRPTRRQPEPRGGS